MSSVDIYINAATRDNTRRSYRSAIEHFESEWGGFLPTTADSIARYLADHAQTLSINTLRQRLAAIAQWHIDQGFPDPTKAPMIKKVLKGINTLHPSRVNQTKPLAITQLEQIDTWLLEQIKQAETVSDTALLRKSTRDRAIVLLGFWRGFRSDELSRLEVQHITVAPGEGMRLYLPQTKTQQEGVTFGAPVLSRLCPVSAYIQWITLAKLTQGPVFCSVNRWGQLNKAALNPTSFIRILRSLLRDAGISDAEEYSSHSLRRGFATWANASGWSIKYLMEYVGWKDINSAMRYIDSPDPYGQSSIEHSLKQLSPPPIPIEVSTSRATIVELVFTLESYQIKKQGLKLAKEAIEVCCLKAFEAKPIPRKPNHYRLCIYHDSDDQLTEIIDNLLDEMHQLATGRQCFMDATITNPVTNTVWQ